MTLAPASYPNWAPSTPPQVVPSTPIGCNTINWSTSSPATTPPGTTHSPPHSHHNCTSPLSTTAWHPFPTDQSAYHHHQPHYHHYHHHDYIPLQVAEYSTSPLIEQSNSGNQSPTNNSGNNDSEENNEENSMDEKNEIGFRRNSEIWHLPTTPTHALL